MGRLLTGRAIIRQAVVGSWSSAVPTCTAWRRRRGRCARRRRSRSRRTPMTVDVGQARTYLGHAAQRERADRRAAEATRPPVGQRRGQRVADHDRGGARRRRRPGRLDDAEEVGAELGEHGQVRGEVAAYGGHRRRPRGTARGRRRRPLPTASGADRLTSTAATPGARPTRRASSAYSPSDAAGHADHDGRRRARPARAARRRGSVDAGVLEADGVHQPAGRLQDPRRLGRPAARGGDRAGDEAAEAGQVAVRRQLAAGAAAPGGDHHRVRPRSGSARQGSSQTDPVTAEHGTVVAGPDQLCSAPSSPVTGTGQPWQSPVAQVSGRSRASWHQTPCSSAARATRRAAARSRRRTRRRRLRGPPRPRHVADGRRARRPTRRW